MTVSSMRDNGRHEKHPLRRTLTYELLLSV
jgi:hypothetical protein